MTATTTDTTATAGHSSRAALLTLLREFAHGKPGIEPGNYASWRDYRNESARVTRQLNDCRRLLAEVERHPDIDTAAILRQLNGPGRLTLRPDWTLDYCTGQYFAVEFRPAVARLCASLLWEWAREHACCDTADKIRACMRRHLGASLASRWFS